MKSISVFSTVATHRRLTDIVCSCCMQLPAHYVLGFTDWLRRAVTVGTVLGYLVRGMREHTHIASDPCTANNPTNDE